MPCVWQTEKVCLNQTRYHPWTTLGNQHCQRKSRCGQPQNCDIGLKHSDACTNFPKFTDTDARVQPSPRTSFLCLTVLRLPFSATVSSRWIVYSISTKQMQTHLISYASRCTEHICQKFAKMEKCTELKQHFVAQCHRTQAPESARSPRNILVPHVHPCRYNVAM